jgi:hypothetical protein
MTGTKQVKKPEKDIITRLADAGEDAVQKLGDLPGGKAMIDAANALRERLDEVAARIRAIDPLEKRVTAIEKRLAALESKPRTRARKPASSRSTPRKASTREQPEAAREETPGVAGDAATEEHDLAPG